MTYVLYKHEGYGKKKIISRNKDSKKLEIERDNIYTKTYVVPTIIVMVIVIVIAMIIGAIVGVEGSNAYGLSPTGAGALMGAILGVALSMLVLIIGMGAGGVDINNTYIIEYKGTCKK